MQRFGRPGRTFVQSTTQLEYRNMRTHPMGNGSYGARALSDATDTTDDSQESSNSSNRKRIALAVSSSFFSRQSRALITSHSVLVVVNGRSSVVEILGIIKAVVTARTTRHKNLANFSG